VNDETKLKLFILILAVNTILAFVSLFTIIQLYAVALIIFVVILTYMRFHAYSYPTWMYNIIYDEQIKQNREHIKPKFIVPFAICLVSMLFSVYVLFTLF